MSREKSGAEIVVDTLVKAGVHHVFGIVSIHNMPIVDAISRSDDIEMITARHESSAAHMADGYARASGSLGVVLGSTGPGTTNLMTGLYEAGFSSSRLLAITGQAETSFYGKGKGYVHEAENQKLMLDTVTCSVASPRDVQDLESCLRGVIGSILTGRPTPGAIEIPIDLQYAHALESAAPMEKPVSLPPDPEMLSSAVSLIKKSQKRIILVGGGVSTDQARNALKLLAELIEAPVITTANGKGAFPIEHPLHMGNALMRPPIKKLVKEADLLIAVGTRFQAGSDGMKINMELPPMIHVDIDPKVINLNFRAEIGLVSDAELALKGLVKSTYHKGDIQYLQRVQSVVVETNNNMRDGLGPDHAKALDIFSEHLGQGVFFVRDSTIPGYNWGNTLLPIDQPGGYIFPTSGAIGPGLPLGLGVAIATGKKTIIMHGDGGFMFHVGELATASQYQIPVVIVIFNDGGYGVLRGLQSQRFDGRFNETELYTPDFVKLAESMGIPGLYVDCVDALAEAMNSAMARSGPVLIEINANNMAPINGVVPAPEDNRHEKGSR